MNGKDYYTGSWIFCSGSKEKIEALSGGLTYEFVITENDKQALVIISEEGDGVYAIPPFT